eukprot:Plantae.Rhodophyta-Purpureofilum_apyrenoidigerum.ctg4090.p2 GENE.Plantae.Rhodophyta-Purpureofilum_apyrenoidigerum.ctg4090~~Plantae.Rhodophyta-Purpureofilum_apyrenoidigerum.ctg4090.p2  ORF type:complete len:215 (+),score=51.71 Plantae.Rhodophyta-Purpureofilum_apyrenoidigerum.ctg4090:89-733(+)
MELGAKMIREMAEMHNGVDHGTEGMEDMESMDHVMKMYLFADASDFFVLFSPKISSTGAFVGALVAVFAFSMLAGIGQGWLSMLQTRSRKEDGKKWGLIGGAGKWLALFLHYTEMLIVMSFNIWIILVVLFGHTFGWMLNRHWTKKYGLNRMILGTKAGISEEDDYEAGTHVADTACNCSPLECTCNPKKCNERGRCACNCRSSGNNDEPVKEA